MLPKKEVIKHLGEIAKLAEISGRRHRDAHWAARGAVFRGDPRKERNAINESPQTGHSHL
jgi:small subunit ribosomal protein S2